MTRHCEITGSDNNPTERREDLSSRQTDPVELYGYQEFIKPWCGPNPKEDSSTQRKRKQRSTIRAPTKPERQDFHLPLVRNHF